MSFRLHRTYCEDNLPPIVASLYGEKIPLRAQQRSRITVISIGGGCWRLLGVATAEVVDGQVVHEIGQGESKAGDEQSYDELLWEWFSALKAAPTPDGGPDIVVFKPLFCQLLPALSELKTTKKREEKLICDSMRMLSRFENMCFVPWTENEALFDEVMMITWSLTGCRPQLSWEEEEESE